MKSEANFASSARRGCARLTTCYPPNPGVGKWSSGFARRNWSAVPGMTIIGLLQKAGVAAFQTPAGSGAVVLGTLAFQGATWVLIFIFLRLHHTHWRDAFGWHRSEFNRTWFPTVVVIVFLPPVVLLLQSVSMLVLTKMGWPPEAGDRRDGADRRENLVAARLSGRVHGGDRAGGRGIYFSRHVVSVRQAARPAASGVVRRQLSVRPDSLDAAAFVPLFLLALALTWLYEKTDNLLAPIAAHAFFNAVNLILLCFFIMNLNRANVNEFELIARLTKSLPANQNVVTGAGDDCAVLDLGAPDKLILFKTDAVVEGVHFTKGNAAGKNRAQGAGALPERHRGHGRHAGRRAGHHRTAGKIRAGVRGEKIYDGMNALAKNHGVAIVGGETTTNPDAFSFPSRCWEPSAGANKSSARRENRRRHFCDRRTGRFAAGKHLEFEPRLAEARWLAEHFPSTR
jgi:membrane protease YdiL (CAAX protease family)